MDDYKYLWKLVLSGVCRCSWEASWRSRTWTKSQSWTTVLHMLLIYPLCLETERLKCTIFLNIQLPKFSHWIKGSLPTSRSNTEMSWNKQLSKIPTTYWSCWKILIWRPIFYLAGAAWNKVKPTIINNCFVKALGPILYPEEEVEDFESFIMSKIQAASTNIEADPDM